MERWIKKLNFYWLVTFLVVFRQNKQEMTLSKVSTLTIIIKVGIFSRLHTNARNSISLKVARACFPATRVVYTARK